MPNVKRNRLRERIHEVIFEADTPSGKAFDLILMLLIIGSVLTVMLESVEPLYEKHEQVFKVLEWAFTILFTIEYLLRLYSVYRPLKYAYSFFGIIDFLAVVPTYLALILPSAQYFLVIRALRLIRIFRVLKLGHFLQEGDIIVRAMKASRAKITVFLTFVVLTVLLFGSLMYVIEGPYNDGFSSIPRSVYWTIVTLTTVGYGDIIPITALGQFLSAAVMILGYAVIAVPTGIVSAEFINEYRSAKSTNTQACRYCGREGHADDAKYCKYCGELLNEE